MTDIVIEPSAIPWKVHSTGSHLGIKDAKGKFVIRRAVNYLSLPAFEQLLADFEHIVLCVNNQQMQKERAAGEGSP